MAKQGGPLYFTGTIDDLTFYKMDGVYYARKRTSLNKQRFYKDPAFSRSRMSATSFGEASQLASQAYRLLPKEQRKKGLIGKLTGIAIRLLKEGQPAAVIVGQLQQYTITAKAMVETTITPSSPRTKVLKKPSKTAFSSWQVTANGRLYKRQRSAAPLPGCEVSFDSVKVTTNALCPPCLLPGSLTLFKDSYRC